MDATDDRSALGMRVRREVLGDEHVDRAIAQTSSVDAGFQHYITGAAWADIWGDDTIDRATRSLITIALLAALGHEAELDLHLRAARRTGATVADIEQALMHVGLYAGVPAANAAFAQLKRIVAEDAPQRAERGEQRT